MDRQAAEWDAAAGAGVFTIQAFVALDGARMLPCATVEWRVTPLRGPGAPGTQVRRAHPAGGTAAWRGACLASQPPGGRSGAGTQG
jgi:hypothetical protein